MLFYARRNRVDKPLGQVKNIFLKYQDQLCYRKKTFSATEYIYIYRFIIKNLQILQNYVMFIQVEHVNLYSGTCDFDDFGGFWNH